MSGRMMRMLARRCRSEKRRRRHLAPSLTGPSFWMATLLLLFGQAEAFAQAGEGLPSGTSASSLPPPSGASAELSAAEKKVDLNRAGEEELQTLPGIGPSRARAIVELRRRLGRFRQARQLLRVQGIGRKTFDKLKSRVVVDAQ